MKKDMLLNCALCPNMCKFACSVYLATGCETFTPQKKAREIYYERKGLIEDRKDFARLLGNCSLCGACKSFCIFDDFDLRDFIIEGRSVLYKEGLIPPETRVRVLNTLKYGSPDGSRKTLEKGEGDILYFVSCSTFSDTEILASTEKILAASRLPFQEVGGGAFCCGAPLYFAGAIDDFKKVAHNMKEEFEQRKVKKVVSNCPTCIRMFKEIYPKMRIKMDIEFQHITEFIYELSKNAILNFVKSENVFTYHDPCILARDLGVLDKPRELLKLTGARIVEPVYSGRETHCCGSTEFSKIQDPETYELVSRRRVEELSEIKDVQCVSACPTCKKTLKELNIKDITEILSGCISE